MATYSPVVIMASGGTPFVQISGGEPAPAFTVVTANAPGITLVDENAPPIALFDIDGLPYENPAPAFDDGFDEGFR